MPKRLTDGWFSGLGSGFRNSGEFLGTMVPITIVVLVFVAVIGTVIGVRSCMKGGAEKAKPCTDYSYKMDLIMNDTKAQCTRWPAMTMKLEKRWVKADIVHCKCTPESNPLPEKTQ